jgi:hypothetical protein
MSFWVGPAADSCSAANGALFDHLGGTGQQRRRHGDPSNHEAVHSVDRLPRVRAVADFAILNVMSPFA